MFTPNETVLVYDTLRKTNEIGKVIQKIGKNVYEVMLNGRLQRKSADVLSKTAIKYDEQFSDVESLSDDSVSDVMDYNMVYNNVNIPNEPDIESETVNDEPANIYVIPQRRKRKTELEGLSDYRDSPRDSRTRSGLI